MDTLQLDMKAEIEDMCASGCVLRARAYCFTDAGPFFQILGRYVPFSRCSSHDDGVPVAVRYFQFHLALAHSSLTRGLSVPSITWRATRPLDPRNSTTLRIPMATFWILFNSPFLP